MADEAGQRLGYSVTAAKQGIFQVVISRICMAIPAMGKAGVAGWGTGDSERSRRSSQGLWRALGREGGALRGVTLHSS